MTKRTITVDFIVLGKPFEVDVIRFRQGYTYVPEDTVRSRNTPYNLTNALLIWLAPRMLHITSPGDMVVGGAFRRNQLV